MTSCRGLSLCCYTHLIQRWQNFIDNSPLSARCLPVSLSLFTAPCSWRRASIGQVSGQHFCGRGFRGLFACYTRHDIWRCTRRYPAERIQFIAVGGGSPNRAGLQLVLRRCGVPLYQFRRQRLDMFPWSRHRHYQFVFGRCACCLRCTLAFSACGARSMTTSNQAKQRIASRAAFDFQRFCHPAFGDMARCIGLAVADLVSR